MDGGTTLLLTLLFFAAAALYAAVGHAGGSAYLAAMAIVGLEPSIMKPTSLTLNVLAASIGTYKYWRAGWFSWALFWPFAATSIPAAFIGGGLHLPAEIFRPLVGLALFFAGAWMLRPATPGSDETARQPRLPIALLVGAAVGIFAALTGTGGGIYLSPILVIMNWAPMRQISGTVVPIILCNSAAALLGQLTAIGRLPFEIAYWLPAAAAGAWLGAHLGATRLGNSGIRRLLGVALWIAAVKFVVMP